VSSPLPHGYDAIEPWDTEFEEYEKNGGDLKKHRLQKIRAAGLFVPSYRALGVVSND